mmetsp:Transcript_13396/g.31446  ORF Transcript_13396/g.31446 Transcript_13396/m.31446 type:complete len:222 (-) Transcript_13396:161-826(-)
MPNSAKKCASCKPEMQFNPDGPMTMPMTKKPRIEDVRRIFIIGTKNIVAPNNPRISRCGPALKSSPSGARDERRNAIHAQIGPVVASDVAVAAPACAVKKRKANAPANTLTPNLRLFGLELGSLTSPLLPPSGFTAKALLSHLWRCNFDRMPASPPAGIWCEKASDWPRDTNDRTALRPISKTRAFDALDTMEDFKLRHGEVEAPLDAGAAGIGVPMCGLC